MDFACSKERFELDIKDHSLEILKDDDLYRHLKMSRNGSCSYHFYITTWPGYLCISGDMGAFVFSRIPDMFEFFRGNRGDINPGYWGEKLDAISKSGFMEYDSDRFEKYIRDQIEEWKEANPNHKDVDDILEEIDNTVLCYVDNEHEIFSKLYDYDDEHGIFCLDDLSSWSYKSYTFRYIWCLYAIVHAINLYDKTKES